MTDIIRMDRAIRINAEEIPTQAIAAEMQFHPAATPTAAWQQAATALAVRALLLQEATRLNIAAEPADGAGDEEARIRSLLAREVTPDEPTEADCRQWFDANRKRFRGRDIYEAAHILLPVEPTDKAARDRAKVTAKSLIAALTDNPRAFTDLARTHSACPSASAGGQLGQMSRGDLVDEVETFILALEPGQICPVPVTSRHGVHVLRLDRLERAAAMDFATARPFVERELKARSWQHAVAGYIRILADRSQVEGIRIVPRPDPHPRVGDHL